MSQTSSLNTATKKSSTTQTIDNCRKYQDILERNYLKYLEYSKSKKAAKVVNQLRAR